MPSSSCIFSTSEDLQKIRESLHTFARLPFAGNSIPGAVMEHVLAVIRGASVLNTYDFVDVINRMDSIGWQVKSTKESTPVTWKRAKIPNSRTMIARSDRDKVAIQKLGDAIITFCNDHGRESLAKYSLESIGYARLIMHRNGTATYFERELITAENPQIFDPADFTWTWSKQKRTKIKEQLPALHGLHRSSGKKWFAWHGRGENQLHFSGEGSWWPSLNDPHAITFSLPSPSEKVDLAILTKLFAEFDTQIAQATSDP